MPSVSVVVPLYNYARWVEAAIESVIGQTLADWELIVVDDGSTDGGDAIAAAYVLRFPSKIRCLSHPGRSNLGAGATRNLGIQHASGRYIAFLDADDIWLPSKLERQVEILDRFPEVGLTYGIFTCVDENAQPLTGPTGPYGLQGSYGDGPAGEPFRAYEMLLEGAITAPPSAVMLRKDLLVDTRAFPAGMKLQAEDQVVWARIAKRASFYFVPEVLTLYRVHTSSWSGAQSSHSVIDADVEFLRCVASDSPDMDPPLVDAFARSLRRYWKAPGIPAAIRLARMADILRFVVTRVAVTGTVGRLASRWRRGRWQDRPQPAVTSEAIVDRTQKAESGGPSRPGRASPDRTPLVSLTIPFLNTEKYIAEAIESALAQTFDSWELLLVDDGSTDGSTRIAKEYARQWPGRIRYLEHPGHENRGMTESRNLGLRNSRGRYIARLDSDDVLRATAFEDKVAILEANPTAGMTYGPTQMWFSWSGEPGAVDRDQVFLPAVPLNSVVPPPALLLAFVGDERNEATGMFVRREVMEEVGGYTSEAGYLYEDMALNTKITLRYPVFVSTRNWYRYRQHPEQHCAVMRRTNQYDAGRLRFLEWVGKYLAANQVTDPEVWAVQRKAVEQQRAWMLERSRAAGP
jgi:glycosyltransferase involved in cell wall biosynthesis